MIVADSNLIAYLLIPGPRRAEAAEVLRTDAEWASPLLWRSEFRNLLALYMRHGHLALHDTLALLDEAEQMLSGREFQVDSAPVLRLVQSSGCTAYDCEFVHLAHELSVRLVTSDRKVLRAFPSVAVSMGDFVR